jgi:type VI secretion system secreted protein Hcp
MAIRIFLEIDGVEGESSKREGAIDCLTCSFGIDRPTSAHLGSGSSTGDITASDSTFTHFVDKASAALRQNMFEGKQALTANLYIVKPTAEKIEYIKYEMEGVMITGVHINCSPSDDAVTEDVTLSYERVTFTYTPEKEDGTPDAECVYGMDVEKSEPL